MYDMYVVYMYVVLAVRLFM